MNEQRKEFILDQLRLNRKVKASSIVKKFNVSMETVRRDLEELEKQGLLRKVYGGATVGRIYETEKPYGDRQIIRAKEKQAIAKATVDLLEDDDTLFLDGGTTLLEIAKEILAKLNNTGVAIEEDKQAQASLYIAVTNKIIIASREKYFC